MDQERLTRRELAERLAGSADPDAIRLASGRIQHWTESGLLLVIEKNKHVGRGQKRTYRHETLWACAILAAMVDRGATVYDMLTAVLMAISPLIMSGPPRHPAARAHMRQQRELINAAISGEKTVILMIRTPTASVVDDPERLGNVRLDEIDKIEIPTGWGGGHWINVTEAFAKVR